MMPSGQSRRSPGPSGWIFPANPGLTDELAVGAVGEAGDDWTWMRWQKTPRGAEERRGESRLDGRTSLAAGRKMHFCGEKGGDAIPDARPAH